MTLLVELTGTAGMIVKPGINTSRFFKHFDSASDIAYRGSSIIAAPFILTGYSIAALLMTGWELLKAVGNFLTFNFSEAVENISYSASFFVASPILFITALASPLINLVDFIGSIITSINHQINPPEKEFIEVMASLHDFSKPTSDNTEDDMFINEPPEKPIRISHKALGHDSEDEDYSGHHYRSGY